MNFEKLTLHELGRMDPSGFKESIKMPVIIVLDNVRSAHNIGSIFRTCDAFRVEALFLTGICAIPPQKELMKTALGATETVAWKYFPTTLEAIRFLDQENYLIAAVEQATQSVFLQDFTPQIKTAFVFGNEVNGVSAEVLKCCHTCVEIPQFGTKHSFNVSITAGIILWDTYNKTKTL
ncbi:MAG: RNA methyltransferase [Bacteroidetes bacterium]|nr:RNA methyltransferase [Bacteroidota bacterium]